MRVGIFFSRVCVFFCMLVFHLFSHVWIFSCFPSRAYTRRVVSSRNDGSLRDAPVHAKKGLLYKPFPYNFQFLDEIILYFLADKRFHLHLLNELAIFLAKLRKH